MLVKYTFVIFLFDCLPQATDGDIGINAAFFYAILSGNSDNTFVIDSVSGALSTTGPLDREKHDSHILLIRVSDLRGNHSYGVVFDDTIVVEVLVEVSHSPPNCYRLDSLAGKKRFVAF